MRNREIDRVTGRIAQYVIRFFTNMQSRNKKNFTLGDLTKYVNRYVAVSPESPGRILRELKRTRVLNYVVTSRQNSEYKFLGFPRKRSKVAQ